VPIYEYRCRACGHEFERLVRGSDASDCPSCSAPDVERLISAFAVNSEGRSHAMLQSARRDFTLSETRKDQLRHEQEEVREHVQEDYGLRVPQPED
jgi:putative FmdB family regulatory protein